MADEMGTGGTIVTIVGAITGAGWIGSVIRDYLANNKEIKLKTLELEDDVQDLTKERDGLLSDVDKLSKEKERISIELETTQGDVRALQQKLQTIHTAFSITYLHLKTKLPADDEILAQLKQHIDKGMGNLS